LVTLFPKLLSRPLIFVRRGVAAPLSASSTAFIAEPANLFGVNGSVVLPWACEQAARLAEHGYSCWCRPDLTQWAETGRALLLATGGLTAERARKFGFVSFGSA
jgi:hypothetical protein